VQQLSIHHTIEEVEQICTRIAILDKGRVIASGTKEELKDMISHGEKIVVETFKISEEQLEQIRDNKNVVSADLDDNNILTIRTKAGASELANIITFINSHKISYGKIYSELPTLNDVFLEITGKELRD